MCARSTIAAVRHGVRLPRERAIGRGRAGELAGRSKNGENVNLLDKINDADSCQVVHRGTPNLPDDEDSFTVTFNDLDSGCTASGPVAAHAAPGLPALRPHLRRLPVWPGVARPLQRPHRHRSRRPEITGPPFASGGVAGCPGDSLCVRQKHV